MEAVVLSSHISKVRQTEVKKIKMFHMTYVCDLLIFSQLGDVFHDALYLNGGLHGVK